MVLGNLIGFDPVQEINADLVFDPVLQRMGITKDQYGESNGNPWTYSWFRWAFRDLCDKRGFGHRLQRGQWGLTPTGVARSRWLWDQVGGTPVVSMTAGAPAATTVPDIPRISLAPMVVPVNQPTQVVPVVSSIGSTDPYHSDPYIRGLATEVTRCFSGYSGQSPICSGCPISGPCINALAGVMSRMRVVFADEDAAKVTANQVITIKASPTVGSQASAADVATNVGAIPKVPSASTRKVPCQQATHCGHCGREIHQGDMSVWVRRPAGGRSNMYHTTCVEIEP